MSSGDAPIGAWPLSAAATALLRTPLIPADELLRLSVRELVMRGAWRLEPAAEGEPCIHPGATPAPALAPLPALDRQLRLHSPDGGEVAQVVRRARAGRRGLAEELRHVARRELVRRGLATNRRRALSGTRLEPTAAGRAWSQAAAERIARVDVADAAALASLGALVLLLEAGPRAELDAAMERARQGAALPAREDGVDRAAEWVEMALDWREQLDELGVTDALDTRIDHAVYTVTGHDGGGGHDGASGHDGGGGHDADDGGAWI
jgi:hypothetical protein